MPASGEDIGAPSTITVRRMVMGDVSSACSILRESPEASAWSEASLWDSGLKGVAWTAVQNGSVAGVLIGRIAADEFEILNLAVYKASRRRGIATQLVSTAVQSAEREGAQRFYLEVRSSNEGGLALYHKMGFQVCGRRPNYYANPSEDAVLLVLHRTGTHS
jgi:ribosomal-protein-alanine N-acetyltransferase